MKRLRSLSLFAFFAALLLGSTPGCGGGSGPGGSTGGSSGGTTGGSTGPGGVQPGDTPMTATAVQAVLDAADGQFSSIVNGTSDQTARAERMAAWMKTRPEFAASGVTETGDVWGRLKNGQLFVGTSSFIPGEGEVPKSRGARAFGSPPGSSPNGKPAWSSLQARTTPAARADTKTTLPSASQARVLLSLDKEFFSPPNDDIADMLRNRNYSVVQQTATVENLKHVEGDGAFYWGTHGTIAYSDRDKTSYWAAWTADDVTPEASVAHKDDLDDGSLVFFCAAYKQQPNTSDLILKTHYAITTKFIDKYSWSFAPHAFIFMNCCHSDNGAIVIDIADRSDTPGGTFGWSGSVLVSSAWRAGRYAFDRLLGSNVQEPKEPFNQRPFDASEVYFDMKDLGFDKGGDVTRLKSRQAQSPALAPSIERMEVAERIQESPLIGKTKLTLYGDFGDDKGTVKIDGVEVPITTWATDKVECEPADLPGPGFAGDVVVVSHDRTSNSVPLTQWHGTVTYDIDLLPPQAGSAHSQIVCDVYFRGDVHQYREIAGRGLQEPKPFDFRVAQGSTSKWTVTGSPPIGTVYSGPTSGTLPFGLNGTTPAPFGTGYIVSGNLDASAGKVGLSFSFLGCTVGYTATAGPAGGILVTLRDPALTSVGSGVGSDGYVKYANDLAMPFGKDDAVIAGFTKAGSLPAYNPKLTVSTFVPSFAPDRSKGEDDSK